MSVNISAKNVFRQTYGIGMKLAEKMCYSIRVSPDKPYKDLSNQSKEKAFQYLENQGILTGFDLRERQLQQFVHLYNIKHVKALKHRQGLPINGQRNCTNGITARKRGQAIRKRIEMELKSSTNLG